jgi:hypothetical protein
LSLLIPDRHAEKVTISESLREKDRESNAYGFKGRKPTEGKRQKEFLLKGEEKQE